MGKAPDPKPPPKRSEEDRKFFGLLKKLVAVPREEIEQLHAEHQGKKKRRRKRS